MNIVFEYQERRLDGATIIYLNASSLKVSACPRRYGLMVTGRKPARAWLDPEGENILETGKALHKFAEVFTTTGGDLVEALTTASRQYPHVARSVIIAAGATRPRINLPPPLIVNGKPAVEVTFDIPWYSFVYKGKLYQFVLCGTMDHIAFDNGILKIYDFKSARGKMIEYVLAKYEHDTQFAFYQWIVKKFKARMALPLEVCNAVDGGRICSHVVPIQLTLKEPRWTIGPIRSLTAHQFDEYENELLHSLDYLAAAYLAAEDDIYTTHPTGMINNSCLYCDYKTLCFAQSETKFAEAVAALEYVPYNPLKRGEENE